MADYTPVYSGGVTPFTVTTSAAVTGGRLAAVSGDGTVGHAAADSAVVVGVFAHDTSASGARVTVWPLANCIHEITAPGAVAQAVGIVAAANGEVAAAAAQTGLALLGVSLSAKANGKVRFVGR